MQLQLNERKLLWIALLVGAIFVRNQLIATLIPFMIAFVLAALVEPVVNLFQKHLKLPRAIASVLGLALAIVTGLFAFFFIFTKVVSELIQMGALLQRYQRVPVDFASNVIEWLNDLGEIVDREGLPAEVQVNLLQSVENLARTTVDLLSTGIKITLQWATQVPFLIVVTVVTLLATFFLVKDRDIIIESFLKLSPPRLQEEMRRAWYRIVHDMVSYLKAQAVLISITTVAVAIGLLLIEIDYWVTLALVAGFLDLVPVLGPGFLFVPWAIGAFTLGETSLAINLLALFAVSFFIRQLFQAKLLGDSIGIHPLTMLIALYGGIHFFGVYGIIIAPLIVIVIKAIYAIRTERVKATVDDELLPSGTNLAEAPADPLHSDD